METPTTTALDLADAATATFEATHAAELEALQALGWNGTTASAIVRGRHNLDDAPLPVRLTR